MSFPSKKSDFRSKRNSDTSGSRIPPHSIEAEESVLGGILLDNHVINTVLEIVTAEDFYRSSNASIFAEMQSLSDKRDPIDVITLTQALKTKGLLTEVGGVEAISRLASITPTSANSGYYSKIVKELSLRRKVIHEASEIVQDAFSTELSAEEFLDHVETKILSVAEKRSSTSFYPVSSVVQESLRLVEKMYDRKEPITGVPSGFKDLDMMTAGWQPSDLVIVAARPAMGKTSLVLSMAQWIGIHLKRPVALFSLEMSKEQLVMRMLCSEARVSASKVRTGQLSDRDFPKIVESASIIAEAPIYIDDTAALSVTEMRAKARRLHRENPLSLIIVDYLQLMRSPTYSDSREQEIADISRSLKALAKELSVPVIALSQLNRAVESRTDKRPMMADLRESGAIEQDADIITFIYRDEVYNPDTQDKGVAELIVGKHRSGPTGTVRLAFSGEYTRFDSLVQLPEYAAAATTPQGGIAPSTQFVPPSDDGSGEFF